MKKIFIAGNWKMNKTNSSAKNFVEELKKMESPKCDVAIMAPYIQLSEIKTQLKEMNMELGAQNVYFEDFGAFTGEISAPMLNDIGVDVCIVGHSERRAYFHETDEDINKKIKSLLKNKITPILCVGESLEIRNNKKEYSFVENQLKKDLYDIDSKDILNIIIAYEPIWAIGTGETASKEQADDMCKFIRKTISEIYHGKNMENLIIQYGGSMKPSNAKELLSMPNINGGLIGGASLAAKDFCELIKIGNEMSL